MELLDTKTNIEKPVNKINQLPIEFQETLSYLLIGKTQDEIKKFENIIVLREKSFKPNLRVQKMT